MTPQKGFLEMFQQIVLLKKQELSDSQMRGMQLYKKNINWWETPDTLTKSGDHVKRAWWASCKQHCLALITQYIFISEFSGLLDTLTVWSVCSCRDRRAGLIQQETDSKQSVLTHSWVFFQTMGSGIVADVDEASILSCFSLINTKSVNLTKERHWKSTIACMNAKIFH